MALQSSQRLPELLFYTKKSYRILQLQLQLQFQLQFYKGTYIHHTAYREFIHPEYNSTCRRQRALRVLQFYMQKTKSSSSPERNSTHRRQGDLLEMHPCVLQDLPVTFQAFQPQVLTKATPAYSSYSRDIPVFPDIPDIPVFPVFPDIPVVPDIPDIPVIHDLPAFPGNSTNSTVFQYLQGIHPIPAFSIRMHILQFLQFDWFPQKTPPSTS